MEPTVIIKKFAAADFIRRFLENYPEGNIYLVGGCIRDLFLGIESSDFDLVVENVQDAELIRFLEKEGKVVTVYGRTFGVVKFKPKSSDIIYDIALPRREKYVPGQRRKHATVELENVTIDDDLSRRDFTVNAMAVDLRLITNVQLPISVHYSNELSNKQMDGDWKSEIGKYLIDPFNGLADLKNKVIRTVGDSKDRFFEDPTRILRGIRFAVQFGFTIDQETFLAMRELASEITRKFAIEDGCEVERVAWETVGEEFMKSLKANPEKTIRLYEKTGLLRQFFPEIEALKGVLQPPQFHSEGDVYEHTLLSLSKLPEDASFVVKFATLLHDIGKAKTFQSEAQTGDRIRFNNHAELGAEMAKTICRRLYYSNDLSREVFWLVNNHIKIFFSFFKMRLEKQRAFVRSPYFDDLLVLARVDTLASLPPDGKPDLGRYQDIVRFAKEIREKDKGRPKEIINGCEIIELIKHKKPKFDSKKHGKYVGALKKKINTLYDREELNTKDEAKSYLIKLISNEKEEN